MKITITADVVAWYAAIVATLALAVNGYIARRDRAWLTVTALSGYRVTPGAHSYSPEGVRGTGIGRSASWQGYQKRIFRGTGIGTRSCH